MWLPQTAPFPAGTNEILTRSLSAEAKVSKKSSADLPEEALPLWGWGKLSRYKECCILLVLWHSEFTFTGRREMFLLGVSLLENAFWDIHAFCFLDARGKKSLSLFLKNRYKCVFHLASSRKHSSTAEPPFPDLSLLTARGAGTWISGECSMSGTALTTLYDATNWEPWSSQQLEGRQW